MKKPEFNHSIKSYNKVMKVSQIKGVNKLKKEFPYCESIHVLSLLEARLADDVNFPKILATTSLYSSNRKKLFQLIYPKIKIIDKKTNTQSFEHWLNDKLLIQKKTSNNIQENINNSIQDNDNLTTETLAKIYVDQGHYERAIQAYQILCLKYPKKSVFFADQIKNIKNNLK
tara:strand:+ start:5476 stop:5991 length:516 start_codon:yes stop_codon:yes gene_type:complete